MEEYFIKVNFKNEKFNYNIYHDKLFSESEVSEIIQNIYEKCIVDEPKVFEQKMLKYYIDYKLRNDYGFVGYQCKNIYEIKIK